MPKLILVEWLIIFLALISLWPVVTGYQATWYRIYLLAIMLALLWVTRNRILRTRDAAKGAQKKHDETMGKGLRG